VTIPGTLRWWNVVRCSAAWIAEQTLLGTPVTFVRELPREGCVIPQLVPEVEEQERARLAECERATQTAAEAERERATQTAAEAERERATQTAAEAKRERAARG